MVSSSVRHRRRQRHGAAAVLIVDAMVTWDRRPERKPGFVPRVTAARSTRDSIPRALPAPRRSGNSRPSGTTSPAVIISCHCSAPRGADRAVGGIQAWAGIPAAGPAPHSTVLLFRVPGADFVAIATILDVDERLEPLFTTRHRALPAPLSYRLRRPRYGSAAAAPDAGARVHPGRGRAPEPRSAMFPAPREWSAADRVRRWSAR
jgi:hypothetical protein